MRAPFATWRGSPNVGGTPQRPPRGFVVHVEVGTEAGTNACFQNPSFQASAHFGVDFDGSIDQWVDTDNVAWAEVAGNRGWISAETAGTPDAALTAAQVASLGRLYAWLRSIYPNIPLQTCDHDGTGLTTHAHYPSGVPDPDWGGHPCPGALRSAQLPAILAAAGPAPVPTPTPTPHKEDAVGVYSQSVAPGDQATIPIPPPHGGAAGYGNVWVSFATDFVPCPVRIAIGAPAPHGWRGPDPANPGNFAVQVPVGRQLVLLAQAGDQCVSVENQGQHALGVLVEWQLSA